MEDRTEATYPPGTLKEALEAAKPPGKAMHNRTEANEETKTAGYWGRFYIFTSFPVVLVLISSMINMCIINGVWRAYGYIYLEFLALFGSGSAETSWVAFTFSISQGVVAPFTGFICDRFSIPLVAFCSGILGTVGLVATAFCQSITAVIITYGLLVGVSMRFTWVAVATFINKHFSKHQLLANGFMFTGSSIGGIAFPFLINYLSFEYTSRGALVILAGVWLHLCPMALILSQSLIKDNPHLETQLKVQNNEAEPNRVSGSNQTEVSLPSTNVEAAGELKKGTPSNVEATGELKKGTPSNIEATGELKKGTPSKENKISFGHDLLLSMKALLTVKYLTTAVLCHAVATGMHAVSQFLPAYAKQHGWDKNKNSTLMAILYSCDLVARMTFTLIGDWKKINKDLLLASVLALCGILTLLFSVFTYDVTFYIYAAAHGLFGDSVVVFLGYTITSSIGIQHVGLGLGVGSVLFGLSGMASAALVGNLHESTHSYVSFLYLTGSMQILGAIVYLIGRNYDRCQKHKRKTYVVKNETNILN